MMLLAGLITLQVAVAPVVVSTCAPGQFVTGISMSGVHTCETPSGGSGPTFVVMSAPVINATTSYGNLTDLVIPISANQRLVVKCYVVYSANATTTGIGVGWTGPGSPVLASGQMVVGLTSATIGGTTVQGNDTGGVTTASVALTGNLATFRGIWINGPNAGSIQMRFKAEVAIANAITAQPNSVCSSQAF